MSVEGGDGPEGLLVVRIAFTDGSSWEYPLALNGREVSSVELAGGGQASASTARPGAEGGRRS